MADCDGHVFHRDHVFQADIAGVFNNLGAAGIAEVLLDFAKFLNDEFFEDEFGTEDFQVLGDATLDISQFCSNLVLFHAGEAL